MYFRKYSLLFFLFFSFHQLYSQGSIKGNISDAVTKDGLAGAYVSLSNTSFHKAADDKGNFELTHIPAGEYELIITNVGYPRRQQHVVVKDGKTTQVYISLSPENSAMNEVTVFGRADREKETGSRDRERTAGNVINVISSQAMVRSPDINAANTLQRMSGITVSRSSGGDEAYAVIRGMDPRYNNTLVNGIKIASPDNKARFVQLDIIPSDILSSIEISKSLLPDMEGDAIGGTVNMVVKDAPDKTSFKATASIGYSQLFFNEKFIDFKKAGIQRLSPIQRNPPGYAAEDKDFSRSNLDFQPKQAPPTGTLGFSYGRRFLHDKIGFVLADNVQNQYYGNISNRSTTTPTSLSSDSLGLLDITNFRGYTQQLNNGLVAHIDYVFNERNKLNIDNFYIYSYLAQARLSEDTTLSGTGRSGPGTGQIFPNDQSFTQHQHIENIKLSGQHILHPNFSFDWAGVLSQAGRRIPDLANLNLDYRITPDHTRLPTKFDDVTHSWQKNDDKDHTGIVNFDYHKKWKGQSLQLKAGGLYRKKSRFNNQDDYTLYPTDTSSTGQGVIKPDWTNIYDVRLNANHSSGTNVYNPNNYQANEQVYAEYIMAWYKAGKWEAGGGLRVENTSTDWSARVHSPTAPSSGNQTYQDFLPGAFLKYHFARDQNLHLSYFRSISRPSFSDIVPGSTFTGDYYITGNPLILHTVADNYDLRYELFPKGEEHLFVGAFYKRIQDPIEQSLVGASSGIIYLKPINPNTAKNYGGELSFTQFFGKFGVTGNYTYTHSSVSSLKTKRTGAQVIEVRPLQGQTDHVVNVSLLYKDTKHGAFAQLAYEYQGKTLVQTTEFYLSDYYQKAMNTLAFSLEKDIHKHFTVFGKFNNLLNTPSIQVVQKYLQVSKDIYKATYSIGIRYAN